MIENLKKISDHIPKEKISQLKEILNKYSYIFTNFEGDSKDILNAFTFKKPFSSIEVQNTAPKKVLQFIKELEDFLFVGYAYHRLEEQESGFTGEILVSRMETVFEQTLDLAKRNYGLPDYLADYLGVVFGKPLEKVISYCLQDRMKDFKLIK